MNLNKDLRAAAIHEAGHVVLAEHFGGSGEIDLWLTESDEPHDKLVTGRVQMWGLPAEHDAVVALGGVIAEWLDEDAEIPADEIIERLVEYPLSPSDAAGAGDFTEAQVVEAHTLLLANWTRLLDVAEEAIDYFKVTA